MIYRRPPYGVLWTASFQDRHGKWHTEQTLGPIQFDRFARARMQERARRALAWWTLGMIVGAGGLAVLIVQPEPNSGLVGLALTSLGILLTCAIDRQKQRNRLEAWRCPTLKKER